MLLRMLVSLLDDTRTGSMRSEHGRRPKPPACPDSRPAFPAGRMDVGVNYMIASGYTGQTTEVLAVAGQNEPFEQVTGVRVPSYVSLSWTYRFRRRR